MVDLAGRAVLVTRPEPEADGLARRVAAAGGTPIVQPGIAVAPLPDSDLAPRLAALAPGDVVVFSSGNAVRHALALAPADRWPPGLRLLAVGAATAAAVTAAGLGAARAPDEGTGALALLPALASLRPAPRRALLLAAAGGRTELLTALRERGVDARLCLVYRRVPAPRRPGALADVRTHWHRLIVTATSSAILDAVTTCFAGLTSRPLVVTSERLADHARAVGYGHVVVTDGPDDGALIAAAATMIARASGAPT